MRAKGKGDAFRTFIDLLEALYVLRAQGLNLKVLGISNKVLTGLVRAAVDLNETESEGHMETRDINTALLRAKIKKHLPLLSEDKAIELYHTNLDPVIRAEINTDVAMYLRVVVEMEMLGFEFKAREPITRPDADTDL